MAAAACASSTETGVADGAADASSDTSMPSKDAGTDADAQTPCEIQRAYFTSCGIDLTCGPTNFDAWCKQNDSVENSEAIRRAEALCMTDSHCDPADRRDCEYASYKTATQTDAQKALVAAYCQTCEPGDVDGCKGRATTYSGSPVTVRDVFIAAWELSDSVSDEIRTKCTGPALDAGIAPDASACESVFSNCSGGIYLDHLPDCP